MCWLTFNILALCRGLEMVCEVMVKIQHSGLVLSAEGGPCWQHPHHLSQGLLVEHASAVCDNEGPTLALACRLKMSSFSRYC
jgi:hypothetical protein